MSPSSRLFAVAGFAVLAMGLAACSGDTEDPAQSTPSSSTPVEEPSDTGDGSHDGAADIAVLVGDWELSPHEPHTKTPLTINADGTVESPANEGEGLATRGFEGTVEPGGDGFLIHLVSTDAELMEWELTLTEGAMAETWDVVDGKGLKYTLVRKGSTG